MGRACMHAASWLRAKPCFECSSCSRRCASFKPMSSDLTKPPLHSRSCSSRAAPSRKRACTTTGREPLSVYTCLRLFETAAARPHSRLLLAPAGCEKIPYACTCFLLSLAVAAPRAPPTWCLTALRTRWMPSRSTTTVRRIQGTPHCAKHSPLCHTHRAAMPCRAARMCLSAHCAAGLGETRQPRTQKPMQQSTIAQSPWTARS